MKDNLLKPLPLVWWAGPLQEGGNITQKTANMIFFFYHGEIL